MVEFWLLKTEPEEWSWQHQSANGGVSLWDGVRNSQAQKYLKAMALDDLCLFYHSGKSKEVVGFVRVVKAFYLDPSDSSGKCGMVDVHEVSTFRQPVTLARLKADDNLKDFVLFRQPRLSVVPVSESIWKRVCELGDEDLVEPEAVAVIQTRKKQAKGKRRNQEKTKTDIVKSPEKPDLPVKRSSSSRVVSSNPRKIKTKKKVTANGLSTDMVEKRETEEKVKNNMMESLQTKENGAS